jgi:hypothetical protein
VSKSTAFKLTKICKSMQLQSVDIMDSTIQAEQYWNGCLETVDASSPKQQLSSRLGRNNYEGGAAGGASVPEPAPTRLGVGGRNRGR